MKDPNRIEPTWPPDRQRIDQVQIVTIPRYKTSGLSGDEWRIRARIEYMYKGHLIHTIYAHDVETALRMAFTEYYNEKMPRKSIEDFAEYCDQEGCPEKATVTLELTNEFCRLGHKTPADQFWRKTRSFCQDHSTRGDCGLEDADRNYTLLEGTIKDPRPGAESASAFGGVIEI